VTPILPWKFPEGEPSVIRVSNAFYIQGAYNLLSQGQSLSKGIRFEFVPPRFGYNVYGLDGKLTAAAPCVDMLFPLEMEHVDDSDHSPSVVAASVGKSTQGLRGSLELWHRWLAHLVTRSVQRLLQLVDGMPPLGGTCCLYPVSDGKFDTSRRVNPLDLIHFDVCGPVPWGVERDDFRGGGDSLGRRDCIEDGCIKVEVTSRYSAQSA